MLNFDFPHFDFARGEAVAFLQTIPDASVDAFVIDAPYGINLKLGTRTRGKNSIAGDGRCEAIRLWRRWIPEAHRCARPDSAHIVFGTWKSPWMHVLLARHFRVAGCIVWDKKMLGLGHFLRPRWELAYLCVKGKPPRHLLPAPADIWEQCRLVRTKHPCEKPVPLLRRAVRLVSRPGELICDPFAGIASTGVAAIEENRRFIGRELDARHARLGLARLRALGG